MSSRTAYVDMGSIGAYFQQEKPRGRDQEGFYEMTKRYLVTEPYKGWSALGGLGGLIAGSVLFAGLGPVGILGMLFSGLVGAATSGGYATGYHWLWERGIRQSGNKKFLDGRSLGKWGMDVLDTYKTKD